MLEEIESDDDIEIIEIIQNERRPKFIRERCSLHTWDDVDFFKRFRLTKATVVNLLQRIPQLQTPTDRNHAIPPITKLLLTLRLFATGSMLMAVADFVGISEASASRIVKTVTEAIARLRPMYVKLPSTEAEVTKVRIGFYNIARFPRVIGALDCTHIRIQSPGGNMAELYRNRKGYFSVNIQIVGGPDLKIYDVVCRWPGSTHDQTIFNNSNLRFSIEAGRMGDSILLGDSGYECRPYLLTPLAHPQTQAENLYNESQIRTRNVVERIFGVWKRRFPILSLGIRLSFNRIQALVVAAAVLHNLARDMNEADPPDEIDVDDEPFEEDAVVDNPRFQNRNDRVRRIFIDQYFTRL